MNLISKLLTTVAGITLLTLGTWESTQAAIIAQKSFNISGSVIGSNARISDEINLTLSIEDELGLPPFFFSKSSLFEGIVVTSSDMGKILTATQATDPNFNSFVEILKGSKLSTVLVTAFYLDENNLRGGFGIGVGAGSNVSDNTSSFASSGAGPIDFSGYNIDSISLQIDSLSINNAQQFASLNVISSVKIEGKPVPEPSYLLASGTIFVAGLVLKYKRKRGIASSIR